MRRLYPPFLIVHLGAGALLLWLRGPLWSVYAAMAGLFLVGIALRAWLGRTWAYGRLRLGAGDPHGALRAYEQFEREYQRRRGLWRVCEVLTAQRYHLDAGGLVNQGIALLEIEDPELEPEAVARFKQAHDRARHMVEPAAHLAALAALAGNVDEALVWIDEGMKRNPAELRALLRGDPQLAPFLARHEVKTRLGL
jgi:hypothetical protein